MSQFQVNWGVLGPGRIAQKFVNDLLFAKDSRRPTTIKHNLIGIASNSHIDNAIRFKNESINQPDNDKIQCYGKYSDLLQNKEIDIVYIATPNMNHFELCYKCLDAGKSVLMEKPFTINSKQTEKLIELSRKKKLFLMEAFWTKFNPAFKEIYELCFTEKVIGDIKSVKSDLSFVFDRNDPGFERIYSPALGGGVVLDLGIYSISWPMNLLNHDRKLQFPKVTSSAQLSDTGVDINTTVILKYGDDKLGVASCSALFENKGNDVVVYGPKGRIEVNNSVCPSKYWVYDENNELIKEKEFKFDGTAMYFEADHAGECLSKGLTESDWYTLDDTFTMSKILETVRKQNDIVFPDKLEATSI